MQSIRARRKLPKQFNLDPTRPSPVPQVSVLSSASWMKRQQRRRRHKMNKMLPIILTVTILATTAKAGLGWSLQECIQHYEKPEYTNSIHGPSIVPFQNGKFRNPSTSEQ